MTKIPELPPRFFDAVERLDGDVTLLRRMASVTSEDLPGVAEAAEQAIAEENCEHAIQFLHQLKGMLSTFESQGVTLEVQDMLNTARRGDIQSVKKLFHVNKREIHELVSQVARLANRAE